MTRRPAAPLRQAMPLLFCVGLMLVLGACKRGPDEDPPADDAPNSIPSVVARSESPGGIATTLAIPDALPTIPMTSFQGGPPPKLEITPAAASGENASPLSWSPDGAFLLALLPTGRSDAQDRAIGRLVVLDATGGLSWDSGDLEAPIGGPSPGGWLADGTLVLARRDGTFARPDGSQASSAAGLEGQPREVWVDPRRQRALLLGAGAAYIVGPGQAALRLDDWPLDKASSPRAGFAWSPDGGRIAVSAADGRHLLFDAGSGAAALLLEDGSQPWEGGPPTDAWPAPTWLADGRLLLGTGVRRRYRDGDVFDHRIMNTTSARPQEFAPTYGVEALEQPLAALVSPSGRYILRTRLATSESGPGRSWVIDVLTSEARALPDLGTPKWSPSGDYWLRMDAEGSALLTTLDAEGSLLQLSVPLESATGLREASWSPDGRWILVAQRDGTVTLVDAEDRASPLVLGRSNAVGDFDGAPSLSAWTADGKRMALKIARPNTAPNDPTSAGMRLHMVQMAP